ncbi:hypothetical protein ZWY2020_008863 [Hordeum vulgare]|nr:hypothetical protein ZWY2020_008863 [Hordeum vulgare]
MTTLGDDRDDRERRDRDNSRSREGWGDRIRRSLSCHTRDNSRDNRRGDGRDGRREGGGYRRVAEPAAAAQPLDVLVGSGSSSGVAARALESLPLQGPLLPTEGRDHSPTRPRSPHAARRCSREARTPPAFPPLSPTTVLQPSRRSKRSEGCPSLLPLARPSQTLLRLCSPVMLQEPGLSPPMLPGFEASC